MGPECFKTTTCVCVCFCSFFLLFFILLFSKASSIWDITEVTRWKENRESSLKGGGRRKVSRHNCSVSSSAAPWYCPICCAAEGQKPTEAQACCFQKSDTARRASSTLKESTTKIHLKGQGTWMSAGFVNQNKNMASHTSQEKRLQMLM